MSERGSYRGSRERPSRFSDADKRSDRERSPGRSLVLHVANLPLNWTWKNLKDLFSSKVGDVAHADVFAGDDAGTGAVEFYSAEALDRAAREFRSFSIDGTKLFVDKVHSSELRNRKPKKKKSFASDIPSKRQMDMDSEGRIPPEELNYYGLNKSFLSALKIKPPIPNKAFVMNLSYKVTREKLREIFSMAGLVHHVELLSNPDGTHKGMAVIEFDHPVEVVQAVSMFHKQILYERPIIIQVDKLSDKREFSLPEGLEGIGQGLGPQGAPLRNVASTVEKQQQEPKNNTEHQVKEDQPFVHSNTNPVMPVAQTIWRPSGYEVMPNQIMPNMNMPMATNQSMQLPVNNMPINNNPMGMQMGMQANPMNNSQIISPQQMNSGFASLNSGGGDVNLGNMNAQTLMSLMNLQNQIQQQGLSLNDLPKMLKSLAGNDDGNIDGGHRVGNDRNTDMRGSSYPAERRSNPRSDFILINNLPPGMTPKMIHDKMSEAGEVKFVDVTGPKSATVRFSSPWDAEKAVNRFDRVRINGLELEVSYI